MVFIVVVEAVQTGENLRTVRYGAGNVIHSGMWKVFCRYTAKSGEKFIHRERPVQSTRNWGEIHRGMGIEFKALFFLK